MATLVTFWFLCFLCCLTSSKPKYCLPSDSCWPTLEDVSSLNSSLSKNALLINSSNSNYYQYSKIVNERLYSYPSWVLVVADIPDIQNGVKWASKYNIQISIFSTGHSYTARSTGNNSLMIHLSKLKYHNISSNNDYITIGTGHTWGEIYSALIPINKLIVGGSDLSVGTTGGYMQGGGHSFLTPNLGLSCDWVTSFTLIDANGEIQIVTNTSSDTHINDLYFALRGGGGGTFGIVVDATFKLHDPLSISPSGNWTLLMLQWEFYDGLNGMTANVTLNNIWHWIQYTMQDDPSWMGLVLVGADINIKYKGIVEVVLVYPGPMKDAEINSQFITNLSVSSQILPAAYYETNNLNTMFVELLSNNTGPFNVYLFSGLVPDNMLNDDYTELNINLITNNNPIFSGFGNSNTMVLIGGPRNNNNNFNFTSINPYWRDARLILGVAVSGSNESMNDAIDYTKQQEALFCNFSNGVYSNEENMDCSSCYDDTLYDNSWGNAFWGKSNYQRLIAVKKYWDPNQVFWCFHCVGDDDNYL